MGCRGIPATLERAECDGQPQHSSITVCPCDRTAALAAGGGEEPRHSAHSRIPTQSHMRRANSRFCSGRHSTDQHASQSDKRAARRRSRIQLPAYRRALDMEPEVFGRSSVGRLCDCYQAAKSNRPGLHCGSPARGLIDQREWDALANRSRSPAAVSGGTNGRQSARPSTACGKMLGKLFVSRVSACLFLLSFSSSQLITLDPHRRGIISSNP
jgi:hypothetical protein